MTALRPEATPPISCYIRTLDEEPRIGAAICAAPAVARKVVVVDSGSTDGTIAAAHPRPSCFFHTGKPHATLDGPTTAEAYRDRQNVDMMDMPLRVLPASPQAQLRQEECFKRILAA